MNVKGVSISTTNLVRLIAILAIVVSVMVMANQLRARVGGVTPAIAAEVTQNGMTLDECNAAGQKVGSPIEYGNGLCFIWKGNNWEAVAK